MEGWAKEWELGVGDERALLLAAADVLRASKKKKAGPADGYRLALKALATYQVRPWVCQSESDGKDLPAKCQASLTPVPREDHAPAVKGTRLLPLLGSTCRCCKGLSYAKGSTQGAS